MSDLKKLKVSLTKHGAHKVAALLKHFPEDRVLEHLNTEVGIAINLPQAKKTLAVNDRGVVPPVWGKARKLGNEAIDALVLIAIIFSHFELIRALRGSEDKRPFAGTIRKGDVLDGKAFTNLACVIEELGYSYGHTSEYVKFDFRKMFYIDGLSELVQELLTIKLRSVGWNQKNKLVDEVARHRFHEIFSVPDVQFRRWLSGAKHDGVEDSFRASKEAEFFFDADDESVLGEFIFRPGHNNKKIGVVTVRARDSSSKATLLHNEIQNSLYAEFVEQYGEKNVGTEVQTGASTSIDIVVKTEKFCWFFEIKTASSVKAAIRQALPQLLEYAYWHGGADRADRLIIVSPLPITNDAKIYLSFLKEKFGIPIDYQQYKKFKS